MRITPQQVRHLLLNPELGRQLRRQRDIDLLHELLKERGLV